MCRVSALLRHRRSLGVVEESRSAADRGRGPSSHKFVPAARRRLLRPIYSLVIAALLSFGGSLAWTSTAEAACRPTTGGNVDCDTCADMGPNGLSPDNDLGGPGGGSDVSNNISCRVRQLQPGQTITVDVRNGSKDSSQTVTLNFAEQPSLVPLTPTSYSPVEFPTVTTVWSAIRSFTNNTAGQGDATVQVSFSVTPPPGPSPGPARAETFCQCTGDAQTPTITVRKETVDSNNNPLNTSDNFGFEITPLNPNITFDLNTQTNNPQTSQAFTVATGQSYTIAETPTNPWALQSVSCQINNGTPFSPTITNNAITLDPLGSTDEAVCTFRNRFEDGPPPPTEAKGSLEVRKVTIGGDGLFEFTVSGQPSFSLKNGQDKIFRDLPVGAYTIREADLPKGWELQNVSCNKGGKRTKNGINVSLGDGDAISCTFTNFKKEDEVMENLTRLFVHRRVDNLLTYGPGRSRILRRLQEPEVQPLKGGPLKFSDERSGSDEESGVVTKGNPVLAPEAYSRSLNNNGIHGQQSPALLGREAVDQRSNALDIASGQRSSSAQRSTGIFSSVGAQLVPLATGQNNYRFAMSLSDARAAAAEAEAQAQTKKLEDAGLGFTEHPYLFPYADLRQGFDIWVEGQFARYDDSSGGIDRDGDFSVLYFGADYTLTPDILVGALVQVDFTDEDIKDSELRGNIDGTGWMAGPYVGLKLTDYLFFDARAAWGTSSNDIWVSDKLTGRRSGNFDTDRWLATAALTGNHNFGAWRLSPQIGIDYGSESFDTYSNSLSQNVSGNRSSIGRLRGGAELGYRMQTSGGTIVEPTVSITGLWDFDNDDFSVDGVPVDYDDTRAKVEGGLIVTMPSGWSVRGAATYDGIGASDFDAYGGQFWLSVPLN